MATNATPKQVGPWTDGVIYASPADELPHSALYGMQNMVVNPDGSVATRKGWDKYPNYSTAYGAIAGTPIIREIGEMVFSTNYWASNDPFGRFIIAGGKFYADLSGTWLDRTSSAVITDLDTTHYSWANAGGTWIAGNAVDGDTILKWAGVNGNLTALDVNSRFTSVGQFAYFDNRAWAGNLSSGEDRVWRSDAGDIETWGATAFYAIDDFVLALVPFRTSLTIHANTGIWALFPTGDASVPYSLQKRSDVGSIASKATIVDQLGNMYIVRLDGIYQWSTETMTETQTSITPQKISGPLDGARYWDQVNPDAIHTITATDYPQRHCVWFLIPFGSGRELTHVMVWDYLYKRWYGPFTNYAGASIALLNNKPCIGGQTDGFVRVCDVNIADNGSAIDNWAETAGPPITTSADRARFHYARTYFDRMGGWDITVDQTLPDGEGAGTSETVSMLGDDYDEIETSFTIGTSAIAGNDTSMHADSDLTGYGPWTRLKFSNATLNQSMAIRRALIMAKPIGLLRKD